MAEPHEAGGGERVALKISRQAFLSIRDLAIRQGVTQRAYFDRLAKLMEILAARSGGDPVSLLEQIIGPGDTPHP